VRNWLLFIKGKYIKIKREISLRAFANYNPSFEGENQTELQRFQDVILNDENKLAEELKKEKPSKYVVDHYERNINWAKGEIKKLTTNPEDGLAVVETPESKNANPSKQPDTVIELSNGKIKGKITISREGSESYHGASAKDMSKEKSLASLDERIARAENVVRQLDGANSATAIVDGQKELIKKLKAEKEALQNGVDLGASNLENTEEKIIAEIFRMHEDRLVSLGWNLEEFKALDKEERDYVLWMGVKEEDYSRRKGSEASEDLNLEKRIQDFALVLVERKKKTGSFYFAGEDEKSFYRDNKIEISKAVEDLFNKKVPAVPKDAQDFIKSENEKLAKDASELTAKGVSEGAKEFIKGERVLAEEEKERQKFAGGLEKGL
jgi:hypothetical protein